jgi:O-antigen ligase
MSENVFKRFLWFGVAALLIFPPILRGAVRIWSITPVIFLIVLLVFLWLWRLNNNKEYKFKPTALDKPIIAFALLLVITFIFSINKYDSFNALLRLICYAGLYYMIVNVFDSNMIKRMIVLMIFMGTALSLYGLMQYFNFLPHSWWSSQNFLSSTYVNHSHFSGYLELVIPVTIGTLLNCDRKAIAARMTLMGTLVVMAAAFVLAQSRGAWICLLIALFVMSVALLKKGVIKKKHILVFLLCIAFIFSVAYFVNPEVFGRLNTIASAEVGEASFQTRLKIWQGSINMIKQRPLIGTGIDTFVWGFPRFRPKDLDHIVNYAHNDYLHITAEMGIFALIVIIWILAKTIRIGLAEKEPHLGILGCAVGVLSLALHGLVDFNFHIPANMLLCVVCIAFIMRTSSSRQGE